MKTFRGFRVFVCTYRPNTTTRNWRKVFKRCRIAIQTLLTISKGLQNLLKCPGLFPGLIYFLFSLRQTKFLLPIFCQKKSSNEVLVILKSSLHVYKEQYQVIKLCTVTTIHHYQILSILNFSANSAFSFLGIPYRGKKNRA